MVETIIFLKALGVCILIIVFILTIFLWIRNLFKKIFPDFKYWLIYKVFKRKYDPEIIKYLSQKLKNNINEQELYKNLLLTNKISEYKAGEIVYIYKQMKKLKGGEEKNE